MFISGILAFVTMLVSLFFLLRIGFTLKALLILTMLFYSVGMIFAYLQNFFYELLFVTYL